MSYSLELLSSVIILFQACSGLPVTELDYNEFIHLPIVAHYSSQTNLYSPHNETEYFVVDNSETGPTDNPHMNLRAGAFLPAMRIQLPTINVPDFRIHAHLNNPPSWTHWIPKLTIQANRHKIVIDN